MIPTIGISRMTLAQCDLCKILLLARTAMLNTAAREARKTETTALAVNLARMDADREALRMSERCMRVHSFAEAMEIVKEYVDIQII